MKVAIFDVQHFVVVENAFQFFDDGVNELYLFVSREIYDLFSDLSPESLQRHHWLVHDNPGKEKEYLDIVLETITNEKIDILWISTITNNYFKCATVVRAASKRGCMSVLTLHNVNHFLKPAIPKSLRGLKSWIGRKLLASSVQGLNVITPTLKQYLVQHYGYNRPIFVVPSIVSDSALSSQARGQKDLVFVVPGSIESKRRDYELLLDVIAPHISNTVKIKLVLLGAPVGDYGQRVLNRCRELCNKGASIEFFETYVSADQFHKEMLNADIMIAPVNIETSFAGDREEYGLSKSSGALLDAARYALPVLVPETLRLSEEMKPMCSTYRDKSELSHIVAKLIDDQDFCHKLILRAKEQAGSFTAPAIRTRNRDQFNELRGHLQSS